MDCQLKQTAFFGTDERSRRRPLQRHYKVAGFQSPLPDVDCRVVVGWRSEAAADALEVIPGPTIGLVDQAAPRASSAGVAWIDKYDCDPLERRLVDNQRSQFVEPPICHPCPLAPLNLDPIPDAFEVFDGDQAPAAFGVGNDGFAQDVVGVALKARLFAAIAFERTSRGTSVDLLQSSATRLSSPTHGVNLLAGIRLPGVVYGQVDYAHVDAERILYSDKGSFVHVAGRGENPLTTHEHQVDLAFSALEHLPLPTTAGKRDTQATSNGPNRDSIFAWKKAEDSLVVGLRRVSAKLARFVLSADLECVGDLGDAPDRRLSRESESLTHRSVSQMVQVELPRLPGIDAECCDPVASRVASLKGFAESDGLIFGRQQTNSGDEFHSDALLRFDVPTNDSIRNRAHRSGVIASAPKRRQTGAQARKLLAQDTTRPTLEAVDDFGDTKRRVRLDKKMHMVRHHFECMDGHLVLSRNLCDQFFQPNVNGIDEHLPTIFRTPHKMVLEAENSPSGPLVSTHTKEYTADVLNPSRGRHSSVA